MIESLAWALVALIAVLRFSSLAERLVVVREQVVAPKSPVEPISVPPDLVEQALLESEPWAREEALTAMRELYGHVGDWNAVRRSFGVGAVEESA